MKKRSKTTSQGERGKRGGARSGDVCREAAKQGIYEGAVDHTTTADDSEIETGKLSKKVKISENTEKRELVNSAAWLADNSGVINRHVQMEREKPVLRTK